MSDFPLKLKPGVNTEATPLLLQAGFSASQLIRFFNNILSKIGGWQRISSTALVGVCRGLFAWSDLTGVGYVAAGTDQRLQVYNEGQIYDITPIRSTDNLSTPYTTFSNTTLKITDNSSGAALGDWIYIGTYSAVDGIIVQGFYQVSNVIDGNNYDVTLPSAATSSTTGGVTSLFTTTMSQAAVRVTLNNHGFAAMVSIFTVYVSTTVGGVTLSGPFLVQTVIDGNNFTITAPGAATSGTTGSENGGQVRVQYLLPSGDASSFAELGYGDGAYGLGPYGFGSQPGAQSLLRQWTFGAFGQILVACPIDGGIYSWDPSSGLFDNMAALVENAPAQATGLFVAMMQQQVIAYGITDPNTDAQDPMLIGWCDVANLTVWTASATNQAGTYRLPRGSRIVGGIQGPQYGMLWTDLGVWLQQYIGFPLVYGFNEIAQGCGLISMRSVGVLGGVVYWCSLNQFYLFNGASVAPLPCDVWDIFFRTANFTQQDKFLMAPNSHFNEFFYFYQSLLGNGEIDSYIKYNQVGKCWDYGQLVRTAWYDQNDVLSSNPLGVDAGGLIQQHESTNDADGLPITCFATSGFFQIADGLVIVFIERMIPDFVASSGTSIQITVNMVNYPDDAPLFSKTFTWVAGTTEYIIVRGRGRFAQITVGSSGLGEFWRLGECLMVGTGSGRRP